jgi:hypothetical protein
MSTALAERLLASLPAAADDGDRAAREAFLAAGLPDRKVESWRYSALTGLATLDPMAGYVEALVVPQMVGVSGTLAEFRSGGFTLARDLPAGLSLSVGAGSAREYKSHRYRGSRAVPARTGRTQVRCTEVVHRSGAQACA